MTARQAQGPAAAYRWILFDADGTLFDYEAAESAALQATWLERGLEPRSDLLSLYRNINSALWQSYELGEITSDEIKIERFRRLAEELELTEDPARLSSGYLESLGRQTQLLPGAARLLQSLATDRRLALITNGLAQVQRSRLGLSPIGRHFEAIVISEEVGFAKPDGRIFELALAKMDGAARGDVLMVGDNLLADISGAQRFGLATCWLNLGGRASSDGIRPTYEVHGLDQLRQLLKE